MDSPSEGIIHQGNFYNVKTKRALKRLVEVDDGASVKIGKYLIKVKYNKGDRHYDNAGLLSTVEDFKTGKMQDVVFRPRFIDIFLSKVKQIPESRAKPAGHGTLTIRSQYRNPDTMTEGERALAQAEYRERIKPYSEKADAEIKAANDRFMDERNNISLTQNQAERDKIRARENEIANKIRIEMGFAPYVERGKGTQSHRGTATDKAILNSKVISSDNTPLFATWKRDPGRYDVQGVDTPSKDARVTVKQRVKKQRRNPEKRLTVS